MPALVSILIPCHNAAKWVAATMESALAQTWPAVEVIVVDDGSEDESLAVARSYVSSRVQILSQPNQGAAAARQRALEAAQGEYFQYLDADDLLAPDKISHQMRRLQENDSTAVATARWARFTDNPANAVPAAASNWHSGTGVDYLIETFRSGGMMHPAAWLTPRQVAAAAGPWNTTLTLDDDGEYFTRVVLAAGRVLHCAEAISYYRSLLPGSLSGSRSPAAWRSAFRVCELSTGALLAAEDSPRSRQACALYWHRLAFAAFPEGKELVVEAVQRARSLDPGAGRPPAGPVFEFMAAVLGWRTAKRLRSWQQRWSAGVKAQ